MIDVLHGINLVGCPRFVGRFAECGMRELLFEDGVSGFGAGFLCLSLLFGIRLAGVNDPDVMIGELSVIAADLNLGHVAARAS
jgi:hypothetical protein